MTMMSHDNSETTSQLYCSFGQSRFLDFMVKIYNIYFLSILYFEVYCMHMQKERVYIVQEPSEKQFLGMRREPKHVARPDPEFCDMLHYCAL